MGLQKQLKWSYEDFEVFCAANRDEAMSLLRSEEPDVVTLDLGLPPDPDGVSEGFKVLDEMLKRLSYFLEKSAEMKSRIKSALTYPGFLFAVCVMSIVFLLTFAFPRLIGVFEDSGIPLPAITLAMLRIGQFSQQWWPLLLGVTVGGGFAFRFWVRTTAGRATWHYLLLYVPVFNQLIIKSAMARFSQILAILLNSGVPLSQSLEVVEHSLNQAVFEEMVRKVASNIKQGEPLSEPMSKCPFVPEMMIGMILVGEETGKMDMVFTKLGEFYATEVDRTVAAILKMIEPAMIVFMTVMVGFIAMSVFLPMADITSGIGGKK